MYQTLETVFHHISKHREVRQKSSAGCQMFNSLFGVWKCGKTRDLVFNIYLKQYIATRLLLYSIYTARKPNRPMAFGSILKTETFQFRKNGEIDV